MVFFFFEAHPALCSKVLMHEISVYDEKHSSLPQHVFDRCKIILLWLSMCIWLTYEYFVVITKGSASAKWEREGCTNHGPSIRRPVLGQGCRSGGCHCGHVRSTGGWLPASDGRRCAVACSSGEVQVDNKGWELLQLPHSSQVSDNPRMR